MTRARGRCKQSFGGGLCRIGILPFQLCRIRDGYVPTAQDQEMLQYEVGTDEGEMFTLYKVIDDGGQS